MRKTDINKYRGVQPKPSPDSIKGTGKKGNSRKKLILKVISKAFVTIATILLITSIVVGASLAVYTFSLASDAIDYDITATKLHLTSVIYVNDENGNVKMVDTVDLGLTIDERLADGYYYSKTIRLLKRLLENPELLEENLAQEVDY